MAFDRAEFADLYPFEPRRFERDGIGIAYVDEGAGDPVVFVHGNPTWSFYWRELVKEAVRAGRRAIAIDHVGCGLSDKPGDDRYRYTLRSRVDDLEALLAHLGVGAAGAKNVALALHDWGGAIGMGWAARHAESVERLALFNTGAFRNPKGRGLPFTLWLGRNTPVGAFMIRGGNAFAGLATRMAVAKPLPARVRRAYVAPYDSWANRIATLRFVQDIPLVAGDPAWDEILAIEAALPKFADTPTRIFWGAKDFVFDDAFLAEWKRRLPHAVAHRFADAGHYVVEDAIDRIRPLFGGFLR